MRKTLTCLFLILCMTFSQIPQEFINTASAAEKLYNDKDVTWIGTKKEYNKTLESMFDHGLRKVPVGDIQANGSLKNVKYGLVDISGKFAAEPVYDEIKAYYATAGDFYYEPTKETIFVDGYVQAVRNGKMGLLDSTGKEVIPCQYYAVGLPAEGISRIIKKSGNKYYLGYWSLKKGKEIVKPNKYPVSGSDATAQGTPVNYGPLSQSFTNNKSNSAERVPVKYDFNGGYALVPTGKTENVELSKSKSKIDPDKTKAMLIYAQIIDTNGKQILSGGPYPYRDNGIYPQYGPYMIFHQLKKEKLTLKSNSGTITFNQYLAAGVAGKKGVVIKAQYHGGIRGNNTIGWYLADANMQIIPEFNLFIAAKDVSKGKKEDSAKIGVIDIHNKTIIPFTFDYEYGLKYDSENKVFIGGNICKADGSVIPKSESAIFDKTTSMAVIANGYFHLQDDEGNHTGVVSIKTGELYTGDNLFSAYAVNWQDAFSKVSTDGTLWVTKVNDSGQRKWGLVDLKGNIILPFEYDRVITDQWTRENGYAIIAMNGKYGLADTKGTILLPCEYFSFKEAGDYFIVRAYDKAKYGLFDRKTGKMVIPVACDRISDVCINGTFTVTQSPSLEVLMDTSGKVLTDSYIVFEAYSGIPGLFYNANMDYVGPDGRIVFPRDAKVGLYKGKRVYYGDDLTIVVKSNKVGYINASRLKRKNKKLPATSLVKLTPSPMNNKTKYYMVQYPYKLVYKIGEPFEIKDFILHSEDINGVRKVLDNSKVYFMADKTRITDGYIFKEEGNITLECYYDGTKIGDRFEVMVLDPEKNGDLLDNGSYTISVNGKYLKNVYDDVELWDTEPADEFIVKLVNYKEKYGPLYFIMTKDGRYLALTSDREGGRLIVSDAPQAWRINKYSKYCTVKEYSNQNMIVNAAEQGNGIIISYHKGSTPDNAKLIFTPVK